VAAPARRLWRGLAVLGAVGGLGCGGGGDSGADKSDIAGLFGSNDDGGPKNVCKDDIFTSAPRPVLPTGTAHFAPIPVTDRAPEVDLKEVTCEVSRNQAGEVAGYYASFFGKWDYSYLTDYAAVSWSGKYAGPGKYDGAHVDYAYDVSSFQPLGATGALVIDADGLTGHFTSSSATLNFKCGDASKLSLETVPWPPLPEHTARLVDNQSKLVYEFPNVYCSTSDGKFEISSDGPFRLRYVADGTGTGMHRTDSESQDYAGGALNSSSSGGLPFTIDCGKSPVTGTIGGNDTFVCQR